MNHRHTLATALTLVASLTSFADVKVNESLTVSGYAAGSYRITDPDPGPATDKFDLDAVRTLFQTNFKPATGVISLFRQPNAAHDVTVLDAYATVDVGGGSTVTVGRFLSYLGYESFHIADMAQVSYANSDFLGPIPGSHSGVK